MAYRRRSVKRRVRRVVRRTVRRVARRTGARRIGGRRYGSKRRNLMGSEGTSGITGLKRRINFGSTTRRYGVRSKRMRPAEGVDVSRTGTTTVVKGTTEMGRFRATVGGHVDRTNMLLRMSVPTRVLRYHGLDNFDAGGADAAGAVTGGYFNLWNTLGNGSVAYGYAPLLLIPVNSTINKGTRPQAMYSMGIQSTGRVYFDPLPAPVAPYLYPGLNADAAQDPAWWRESEMTGAELATSTRYVVQDWLQLKLNMYGAAKSQTRFNVEYIQCTKDYAAPEEIGDLLGHTGVFGNFQAIVEKYRDEVYGYWQDKVRPLVTNPIAGRLQGNRGRLGAPYRTIKKWSYDIKPVDTSEADASPNSIVANLFINDGRCLDYQWLSAGQAYDGTNASVGAGIDDRVTGANITNVSNVATSDVQVAPKPTDRRYIVISATTWNETDPTVSTDNQFTPSFDMIIRKKELLGFHRGPAVASQATTV